MSFPDTLVWFQEPGFAVFFFGFLVLAYQVSAKAHPIIQIGMCIFCGSFITSHWAKDQYHSMALYWMYAGWTGFLFHKLGGMVILKGIGRTIRYRFESLGREPAQFPPRSKSPHPQPNTSGGTRRENYSRQEEAFRQRERQREEERRRARTQTEQEARHEQSQSKPPPGPEPSPDPKPDPKQEEKKSHSQPERERTQFWWEVLEIPEASDLQAIKKAYRGLLQKYHPDRVSHLGEEFQVIAEAKTKEINAAFEVAKKRRSQEN